MVELFQSTSTIISCCCSSKTALTMLAKCRVHCRAGDVHALRNLAARSSEEPFPQLVAFHENRV